MIEGSRGRGKHDLPVPPGLPLERGQSYALADDRRQGGHDRLARVRPLDGQEPGGRLDLHRVERPVGFASALTRKVGMGGVPNPFLTLS